MRLGTHTIAPGVKHAIDIDLTTYIAPDSISGTPDWSGATGLTISGESLETGDVARCYVIASQEGVDYNLVCTVALNSGATENFLVVIQCRTGEADPRLTR